MKIQGSGGGKGGSGSGQTPNEAPNTLQSRATARIIDLISEGEVEGIVGDLQGIYLDGTPIANSDGTYNFKNLIVEARSGTPDQPSIPGFPAVESVFGVGTEIKNTAPVVRAITNGDATAALITIRVNALQSVDTSTGDINPTSVRIGIDVQLNGGAWTDVSPGNAVFSGKTSSPYQRSFRLQRPGDGDWAVRVRRITTDNSSSTLSNQTFWDSVTEIEDYQLQYPNSALIAYQVDAQSFGNSIPKRLVRIKGLRTRIPSNYDPLFRTYSGIWDGTFKTAWHNNPAWVLFECIANDRWGLGEYVPDAFRDKWTLYSIGQYCDDAVPDGIGGFEPRYTFNWAISSAEDALKVLMSIASVFRGMIYWGAAGVTATADRGLDPVKLVTPANVIGGMINWGGGSLKARHTVAIVTWYDPSDLCQPAYEVVESSPSDIERFGYRTMEIVAVGCTSRGQAYRMGRWAIETEKTEAESCNWSAAWDHSDVYPGDIVAVQDPSYAGVEFGGRVADVIKTAGDVKSLTLDRPITLESGKSYELSVTLSDGTVGTRPVTTEASTTSTLAFDTALWPQPVVNAVWVLTASDVAPRLVKVIKRVESAKNTFDLSGIFHDATKFDRIERDLVLETPVYSNLPAGPIIPPTGLVVTESLVLTGGIARPHVLLSWVLSPDPRVVTYEAQVMPPDMNWQPATPQFTKDSSIDLPDLSTGIWQFRVRAIDALGRVSTWLTTGTNSLDGRDTSHDGLTLSQIADQIFARENDKNNDLIQLVAATVLQVLSKAEADKQILRSEVSVTRDDLSASISETRTVAVTAEAAVAQLETNVEATFGEHSASITENATAVADINENLAASWGLEVNADNAIASLKALAGGGSSALVFLANAIKFAFPGVSGGDPIDVFQISEVDGVPKIVFRADMYGDGTVNVKAMNVAELFALTSHFGSATVDGDMTGTTGGLKIDFTNDRIVIFGT